MADYAISNVPRRVVYAASGTGPYAFTFEILSQTDIAVYKASTLLTLTTDYTVTINANGTGSVTLVLTAGTSNITIVGAKNIQRTTDFTTGGDLFANTLNDELDNQTIFIQQVSETAERGLKAPVTDPTDIAMTLPVKASRIGKYLSFDSNGNPVATSGTTSTIIVSVAMEPVIGAATLSDARTNLGLGSIATQNSNSVSITGGTITGITDLAVADGGTGASTLAANNVLLGNGTSALQVVAPSTAGNVLTSNGTTWTSVTPAATYPGPRVQAFTTSGTFTVPAGITAVKVSVRGGGGGGASFTVAGGGGGNSSFGSSVIGGGGTGGGTPTGSGDECGTTNPNNGGSSTNVPYEISMLQLKGTYGAAGNGSSTSNGVGCTSGSGVAGGNGVGFVTGLTSGASITITVGAGGTSSGGDGSTAGTAGVVVVEY